MIGADETSNRFMEQRSGFVFGSFLASRMVMIIVAAMRYCAILSHGEVTLPTVFEFSQM